MLNSITNYFLLVQLVTRAEYQVRLEPTHKQTSVDTHDTAVGVAIYLFVLCKRRKSKYFCFWAGLFPN